MPKGRRRRAPASIGATCSTVVVDADVTNIADGEGSTESGTAAVRGMRLQTSAPAASRRAFP
jgi:hypothetical protein